MVNFWVFKDDESESDAKTNSGSPFLAWRVTHTHTHTHTHTQQEREITFPPRADPTFLTHFTAKGIPSIFEWSTLSM